MGSEAGVQRFAPEEIREKGRLKPGKMLLVDTEAGKILYDEELKATLANEYPYGEWIRQNMVNLEEIETGQVVTPELGSDYNKYVTSFNYSMEDTDRIIKEMAATGKEPIGSMGNDVPAGCTVKKAIPSIQLFQAALCPGYQSSYRSHQGRTCNDFVGLPRIASAESSGNFT